MIYIDGDACSKRAVIEQIAQQYNIECHVFCNTHQQLKSDYAVIHVVDSGRDIADFAIANRCKSGDIVITCDNGLAAMTLARSAIAINPRGFEYTTSNIDAYLTARYIRSFESRKRNTSRVKGVAKNKIKQKSLEALLVDAIKRSKTRRTEND